MALLVVPIAASAQPSVEQASTENRAAEAARASKEGRTLFEAGLYDAAIERFEASYAIVPAAEVQLAIAEAYRAKGDNANALRAYRLYRSLTGSGDSGSSADKTNAVAHSTSPEFIEASQIPVATTPPPPVLPRALVQRPLLLPDRVVETSLAAGWAHQSLENNSWSAAVVAGYLRIGFHAGEFSIGCELAPYHDESSNVSVEVPVLQRVNVGMTLRLTDDTGVGARATAVAVDSEFSGYATGLAVDLVPFFSAVPTGDVDTYVGGLQVSWR